MREDPQKPSGKKSQTPPGLSLALVQCTTKWEPFPGQKTPEDLIPVAACARSKPEHH